VTQSARFELGADGFTARLSDVEREALFALGREHKYARNVRVFHEGDRSTFVIVILKGRIKIVTTSDDGGESLLSVRGAGSLVGELAALDDAPRLASAIVLEPLTALVLTAGLFRDFLAQHPRAALELARTLIERLRESDRRRAEFGSHDVNRRLATLLLELSNRESAGGGSVDITLSQQELAGMIGASRESVARALALLRGRGLVETGRRTITVVDTEGLRSLA
jgi:CRP/FNR family transcriptional regulator, cyclic AMP receptor protein